MDGALGQGPVHLISRNGSAHVPAGTDPLAGCLPAKLLGRSAGGLVEQLARLEYGMHDDGEFPCHRDSGALEADTLAKPESPVPQCTLSRATGQDDARCFIQKASYLVVAAPGDVPIVIYLPRLVSARRQTEPCTDRSRGSEVAWIFDRGSKGSCGDNSDARDRHDQLACFALTRITDQASRKAGGMRADAAPSVATLGQILLAAGDPQGAMAAYQRAIDCSAQEQKLSAAGATGAKILDPFWYLVPYAKAAIAAGRLEEAEVALGRAGPAIKVADPGFFAIGNEGLYWLETGNLLLARGETAEARKAWMSSQQSLSQAVSGDRREGDWQEGLAEVNASLAATPQ